MERKLEISTQKATISYEPENEIVVVSPFEAVEIDAAEYIEQFKAVHALTHGKKAAVLIRTSPFLTVTKEARSESLKPDKEGYIIAQAILVTNIANRLIGNFYIKYNNPKIPNKLFSTETEARKWLKEKVAAYNSSIKY